MMGRTPTLTAIAITLGAVALVGMKWRSAYLARGYSYGTTTGEIIVASPEVYSRERLVNDRFQQTSWLEQQLRLTDTSDWGVQASSQTARYRSTSLTADLQPHFLDPAKAKANALGASPTPENPPLPSIALSPTDTLAPTTTSATMSAPTLDGVPHARGDGLQPSPIDLFRDKLAFREEVRAAALETQLDDRHDIAGNTLYRVKFSVTVIPEEDTRAWAVVYVEVGEPSHTDEPPPTYGDLYREWIEYYQTQLNYELDRLTEQGTRAWQADDFRLFSAYVPTALKGHACIRGNAECHDLVAHEAAVAFDEMQRHLRDKYQSERRAAQERCNTSLNTTTKGYCVNEAELNRRCDSSSTEPQLCPWRLDNYATLEALLNAYRRAVYVGEPESRWPTKEQFFRRVVAEYLVQRLAKRAGSLGSLLWNVSTTDCDIGPCRISLDPKDDAVPGFAKALSADQVFAYAVSPKESVQRIANLASAQNQRQLLLRTTLAGRDIPLDLLGTILESTRKDDFLLNSILRKPLLVGFAEPVGKSAESQPRSVAAFGWIIGPKFDIGERGARFRHVVIENDVSAIISVPSWWRWADVRVAVCWIDERSIRRLPDGAEGVDGYADCRQRARNASTVSHLVRLPGNVTEVARKLGLDVVRRPSVFDQVYPELIAGRRADILIRGSHLWRSTVVTLDGQSADNITVLPDMKGIIARFEHVSPQLIGRNGDLWVFTSEGDAYAGRVTVHADSSCEQMTKPAREAREANS
jgi:hypothetical protein